MAKDIFLDIKARDIQMRDLTDAKTTVYKGMWGSVLDGETVDSAYSLLSVVVPITRKPYIKYNSAGVLDILVSVPYRPEAKNIKVRFLTYVGTTTMAAYTGDGVPSISSVVRCKSNDVNLSETPNACELPLINVDGNFLLHFNQSESKVYIYSGNVTDFGIGLTDDQSSQLLMLNAPGKMYRYPLTGIDIYKYLNSVVVHSDVAERLDNEFGAENRNIFDASFDSETGAFSIVTSKEATEEEYEGLADVADLDIDFISALMNYDFGNLIIYPESYLTSGGTYSGVSGVDGVPDASTYLLLLYQQYKAYLRGEITINSSDDLDSIINQIKQLRLDVGDLDELETDTQENLVAAINEVDSETGTTLTEEEQEALDAMVDSMNPLKVTMTGGGTYEIGTTYTPSGTFTVKRGSDDVRDASTVSINSGSISGSRWSDSDVTSNKTWTISAIYNGKTASASVGVSFLPYLYQGVVSSSSVSEAIIKSLGKTLSNATSLGATSLAAGKYYIFACKGNVNLVCRDNSTNGVVSATTGTIQIQRINGTATDIYSYIIVPASDIAWTFKITNS